MRRDTMRDLFGRDLVHLALILSLLRLDVPLSRQPLFSPSNNILFDLDPYEETLSRQKTVLEDLNSLGRFSQPSPSGGNIEGSNNRWGGVTGQNPGPIEISAYVLNTEGNLPNAILRDVRPSTSSGIGSTLRFPSARASVRASNSESDGSLSDSASVSDVDSGIENNIIDFGGYASSQSTGIHSPSSVASGSECASNHGETLVNETEQSCQQTLPTTHQLCLTSEDNVLNSLALTTPLSPTLDLDGEFSLNSANNEFDLDLDFDLGPPLPDIDDFLLGQERGDSALPNVHLSNELTEADNGGTNLNIFSPDEEDVENQLMHIDDQLIRLDDDIENINEGVQRTLDEAIMVHNLAPEAAKEEGMDDEMADAFLDEDSNIGLEALLGEDEEAYLFSSLQQDQSSIYTDSLVSAVDGVREVNPFDDWQADTNRELEDLLDGSIPSRTDVRPPPPVAVEAVIKTEEKEDVNEEEDRSDFASQRQVDSEPEKEPSTIKEEAVSDEEEDDYSFQNGISAYSYGATDALRTSSAFLNNNNLVDSKEFQFGAFDPQIHSSNVRPISSENPLAPNTHLLDHNYAASSYDECFGDSWRDGKDNGASNIDFYELSDDRSSQASPTSSIATSYGGASGGWGTGLSVGYRESRDERKVRQYGLPISCSQIIDSSMEEFNDLLTSHTMSEEQISICRDIRRRGKNKVAAQNCRRRKLNLISHLHDEVDKYRQTKQMLLAERQELYRMRNEWTNKLLNLEEQVLRGFGKSSVDYSLQLMPHSQQIRISQRHTSTTTTRRHLAKPTRA